MLILMYIIIHLYIIHFHAPGLFHAMGCFTCVLIHLACLFWKNTLYSNFKQCFLDVAGNS